VTIERMIEKLEEIRRERGNVRVVMEERTHDYVADKSKIDFVDCDVRLGTLSTPPSSTYVAVAKVEAA
jgi:hypothetical protein